MNPHQGEEGFALITAIWMIGASALLAAALLVPGRIERAQALSAVLESHARAAAHAGLANAMATLDQLALGGVASNSAAHNEKDLRFDAWNRLTDLDSGLDSVRLSDRSYYSVRLEDSGSRLPLNLASEAELRRLFIALGLPRRAAGIASESAADWRDADGLHRENGAEWDDFYRFLRPPVHPRNAPFADLAELRIVRGVGPALFRRAKPYLTVDGDGRVNLNTAPEPVLRALPGLTEEAVRVLIEWRRSGHYLRSLLELEAALPEPSRIALQQEFGALSSRAALEPQWVHIQVTGHIVGSPVTARIEAMAIRSAASVQLLWSAAR